ncbi:non-ribosomal peptide synthetase [Brevibacterium aurantiacum]|uniref:Amino acid adenylation domain-containing protein n=1 Tax=Brevibacterium aurantiacum TaxID=273384 RepID=A0A556CBX7_BREAU|nr:non-ribosomal peptide synthetase [Brevibacterium aurantiacum]TSI14548.1 amino acid adenylation domain-containing protein [Brevibacterium aurantiacum]
MTIQTPIHSDLCDLTDGQLAMWFGHLGDASKATYQCAEYVDIDGPLDAHRWAESVSSCLRVAGLDSEFLDTPSGPRLRPAESPDSPSVIDLRSSPDPEAAAHEWMDSELTRPAQSDGPVVLTARDVSGHALLQLDEDRQWWFARFHHIVIDGFSMHAFIRWVGQVYSDPTQLDDCPFTTTENARGTAPTEAETIEAKGKEFWAQRADRLESVGSLCEATAAAAVDQHDFTYRMGPDQVDALTDYAHSSGSTWIEMAFALIGTYLQSHLTDRPAVLGIPWLNRSNSTAAKSAAPRVNVLPLCLPAETSADTAIVDFAAAIGYELSSVREVQTYRSEWIRRDLSKVGTAHRLHGPTVNIRPFDTQVAFDAATGVVHNIRTGPTDDLDIALSLDSSGGLEARILANPKLYTAAEVQRHLERITDLLARTPREGHRTLGEIEVMLPSERDQILNVFNATDAPTSDRTLADLLIDQHHRTPNAPALQWRGESLMYSDLFDRVEQLADTLREHGAGPGRTVGIHLRRGPAMVMSLLATTLSGAAYVPLEPTLPMSRLDSMIADVEPIIVITGAEGAPAPGETGARPILRLGEDTLDCLRDADSVKDPVDPSPAAPDDTAYVIFTSGSTGAPKGTAVSHRAIVNRLEWMQHEYQLDDTDIVLQKTPFSFDVSVWEFYWPLITGAVLAIAEPEVHKDPKALARTITANGVTTCHFVPSALSVFTGTRELQECTSLRRVFCSGEALDSETAHRLMAVLPIELHNLYGPTEAAVDVTHWPVSAEHSGPVPIGRPVWNTRVYLLDGLGRLLPPGATGHLHLAGGQLAQGYVGRPELTAEKFFDHPGLGRARGRSERVYATGDIARWRSDGALDYLGRVDDQVKIRGLRIELGEIESVLAEHPEVHRAVVVPHGTGTAASLRGYVQGCAISTEELRDWLVDRLPDYMVPSTLTCVSDLPMTANGKLDRQRLPAPEEPLSTRAPSTKLETAIVQAFDDVLGTERLGVDTNFFDAGGTSLTAVSLLRRLEELHDITARTAVELSDVFAAPTAASLARRLGGEGHANPYSRLLTLREHRSGTPVFCLHPAGGLGWSYVNLLQHIDPEIGVYALQAPGLDPALPEPKPAASLSELAAGYAVDIVGHAPQGTVVLLGWSVGGVIAHELAIQLASIGVTVETLTLLDAYPPSSWQHRDDPTDREINEALLIMGGVDYDSEASDLSRETVLEMLAETSGPFSELRPEVVERVARTVATNALLMRRHTARVYHGDVEFFTAADKEQDWLHVSDWEPFVTGTVRNHDIDCTHPALIHPHILARIVREIGSTATQ